MQAQRQLSDLAANESEDDEPSGAMAQPKKKKNSAKKKQKKDYPKLTKAQLRKQQDKSTKENTMRRLFPKLSSTDAAEGFYAGSEHEIYPAEQAPSDSKAPMAGRLIFIFKGDYKKFRMGDCNLMRFIKRS